MVGHNDRLKLGLNDQRKLGLSNQRKLGLSDQRKLGLNDQRKIGHNDQRKVGHTSGKLHKDYTVYEDVKSILPIYIHVYPVRPCRDDLCEIIPSLWGAVARHDRSDLFIIACGQSHLLMNMLWSAMISCELSYHVAAVLPVSCGGNFPHKSLVLNLSSKGHGYHTCIWDKVILGRRLKGYTSNWRFGWY